ncbi:MAG: choice-of-anchor H family protein, partial [Pseudomonadota bacterium]
TVYAKLYLSREGGPWRQYFTTDLFSIYEDDFIDAYEVETELVDGYTPGYYDVLIEIYSLDHAFMVTSEVLDYHYLGRDVALEDRGWDEPYDEYYEEVSVSVGAGDFSALLLFFLIIQVAIAARGIPALTPCKKRK